MTRLMAIAIHSTGIEQKLSLHIEQGQTTVSWPLKLEPKKYFNIDIILGRENLPEIITLKINKGFFRTGNYFKKGQLC